MNTLKYLHDKIAEQVSWLEQEVLGGACTHEQYLVICARKSGLVEAQQMVIDLINKQESQDD